MAHYLRLGVNISVVNRQDCKAIYESVAYHIRSWRENYSFSLNQAVIPLDDLQALENLSQKVFPAAKAIIAKEGPLKDRFAESIQKFDLVTEQGMFVRNDFNKKHNITNPSSLANSIDPNSQRLEIIRDDNSDYLLERLASVGGINGRI